MKYIRRYIAVFLTLALICISSFAYKDLTHQKLTKQACKVATEQGAGSVAGEAPVGFQQTIINAAGLYPVGEDYTEYFITRHKCKLKVHKLPWPFEPLNHFHDGMLWGNPAGKTCTRFYHDAVRLWLAGKKSEAAFVLGRANAATLVPHGNGFVRKTFRKL